MVATKTSLLRIKETFIQKTVFPISQIFIGVEIVASFFLKRCVVFEEKLLLHVLLEETRTQVCTILPNLLIVQ